MLEDDKHAKARSFAVLVAQEIVDCYQFRQLVKETVLRVLVEQEEIRKRGAAQAFLEECAARGVDVKLDDEGHVLFTRIKRLGPDLQAVLTVYRSEIVKELEYYRELEERERQYDRNDSAPEQ